MPNYSTTINPINVEDQKMHVPGTTLEQALANSLANAFSNTGRRIDIEGQRSMCNASIHVARTIPTVLDGHMSEVSWSQFCDKLDDALVPLSQLKRKLMVLLPIAWLISMALIAVPTILTISSDSDFSATTFIPAIVGSIMLFVSCCASSFVTRSRMEQVRQELTKICEEESAKDSSVSFLLQEEIHVVQRSDSRSTYTTIYIEVKVSPISSSGMSEALQSAFGSSIGTGKSVETCLSELEGLKLHLTDEEYQRKREDILASV